MMVGVWCGRNAVYRGCVGGSVGSVWSKRSFIDSVLSWLRFWCRYMGFLLVRARVSGCWWYDVSMLT